MKPRPKHVRMQRVDEDGGPPQRNAGVDHPRHSSASTSSDSDPDRAPSVSHSTTDRMSLIAGRCGAVRLLPA